MQGKQMQTKKREAFSSKSKEKLNEERRQALLLKRAVLVQMKKEQEDIYKSWINRGR